MDFALQCIAITTSATIFGFQFDISFVTIPSLLTAPSQLMVRQWKIMYDRGKRAVLIATPLSTLSYACLAYRLQHSMYTLAAISTFSAIPYTLIFLGGVNNTLEKMAKIAEEEKSSGVVSEIELVRGESAPGLLKRWRSLNYLRMLFPLTGTAFGLYALLA